MPPLHGAGDGEHARLGAVVDEHGGAVAGCRAAVESEEGGQVDEVFGEGGEEEAEEGEEEGGEDGPCEGERCR